MSDPFEFTDEPVDTGFVTATVNVSESEPVEMTPEAIQAAKALVNLPELTTVQLAQLARDIAQDIGMLPVILAKHKLTQSQYEFIAQHNSFFKSTVATETKNWQSIKSTEVRLRLQAQAALEQTLPIIAGRMGNTAEELRDVVEGAKLLSRIAGVDTPPAGPATAGERYQIVIDLGADANLVIAAKGGASSSAGSPVHGTLQTNIQGQSNVAALRRDSQGQSDRLALPAIPEG